LLIVGLETDQYFLFGLLDQDNNEIIPSKYLDIQFLSPTHFAVTDKYRKIGIFETAGRKLSELELDSISDFDGNYALIHKSGKTGVLNREGEVVIKPFYKEIDIHSNPGFKALSYDKWSFLDHQNNKLNNIFCDSIFPLRNNLYQISIGDTEAIINSQKGQHHFGRWKLWYYEPSVIIVKTGNKFGVIDEFGNVILESAYDSIRYNQGYLYTLRKAGSEKGWSLRNSLGQEISSVKYQEIGDMAERRIMARRKGYWGYLNPVGKEVISCKFSKAENFKNGMAKVDYLDGLGIINRNGEWIVLPYQSKLENGPTGLFIIREYFKSFVLNQNGDTIYHTYNRLSGEDWGILEQDQGKFGLLNRTGQKLLDPTYDRIKPILKDSLFAVWKEGSGGIINLDGGFILQFNREYEDILFAQGKFVGVKLDGKYGFIDFRGNLRIANRYEGIRPFENDMAPVKLRGKWGFVNSKEDLIVQPHYDSVGHFQGGYALVIKDQKKGLIDRNGKELFKPEYSRIKPLINGHFLLEKKEKWGVANDLGHIVAHFNYDSVEELDNGFLIISRKNKWGLISIHGETLIPQVYDHLIYDPFQNIYLAQTKADWEELPLTPKY